MIKFWRVCWHEYTRHVLRKSFLFGLFSMPLLIGLMMVIAILSTTLSADTHPMGYVDPSGFLANPKSLPPPQDVLTRRVPMIPYASEAEAKSALESGTIQAYFVMAADYPTHNTARMVYAKSPDNSLQKQFSDFLQINLLANQPPEIITRISEGPLMTIESLDGTRKMRSEDWFNILIPFITGILFFIVIIASGGYLLQAVVEEKENRTMEIIVTSVSPEQLMAGKIIGDLSIGLTMLLGWTFFVVVTILIGQNYFSWMQRIQFGPDYLALMLIVLIPSFVMVAAMMAALGSTVTESREAQQISGLFTLPIMIPYWFTYALMSEPNGPISMILSFFPLTAPVTLTMRAAFTQIPTWQLALNLLVIVAFAAASVWLAARTFRLGMLQYGKRLSWREIFSKAG